MVKEEEKYVGGQSPIGFYWTVFEKEVVLFLVIQDVCLPLLTRISLFFNTKLLQKLVKIIKCKGFVGVIFVNFMLFYYGIFPLFRHGPSLNRPHIGHNWASPHF